MIFLWIVIGLMAWLIAGVVYFALNIGYKTRPEPWYAKVLLLPVIALAYFIGWLRGL